MQACSGGRTTPTAHKTRSTAALGRSGISLVELLVGLAIGLFLLTGALSLFSSQSRATSQALLEAQLNRNLRLAVDFITQDLRRAGAWENAIGGAPSSADAAALLNPHLAISASGSSIAYSYGRDVARGQPAGLNALNTDEQFGVRLNAGVIEVAQGQGAWQPLTDAKAVEVTALTVAPKLQVTSGADTCRKVCCEAVAAPACPSVNAPDGCPRVQRWSFDIAVSARARRDPAMTRTLRTQVQVRNELLSGRCPA